MQDVTKITKQILVLATVSQLAACASIQQRIEGEPSPEAAPEAVVQPEKPSVTEGVSTVQTPQHQATAEYHFSMAQAYVADGNTDRAIEEYKIALNYDPDSALIRARLATEYVKKGMLSAAMEACKEALQRDPKFIDARLMLAGLYSTAREGKLAIAEYDRILKLEPRNEEAIVYKAQTLFEERRAAEAVQSLKAFVKIAPESVLGWYYLGRAQQRQNQTKEAVASYRKSLELRPTFAQGALALGYLYEEKQQTKEAIATYKELYDQSQDVSAANRLATILLKQEKYNDAIPYLESVEAIDPDDMNVRVKLGLIHMELKNYEKAITTFKAILEKNPDSDRIHYYLGSLYEETKQVAQAIEELKKIQPTSKLYSDAALHVAYLYKNDGKIPEAKAQIADAVKQSPRSSGLFMFQASLEEETKDYTAAIGILERATEHFPEDEKIRYYLGSLYDRRGDTDKSLEQMEAILALNPQNVDALNYIGYTWTTKGIRLHDAEKLLRKALGLRPDNGYIQDSWGWHLYVRGRVSEAVVELEKAARLKPNESTILEHLADAYARQNLREKAFQRYREAVRFAEDEVSKKKLEGKLEVIRQELVRAGRIVPGDTGEQRSPASHSSATPEEPQVD